LGADQFGIMVPAIHRRACRRFGELAVHWDRPRSGC